MELIEGKGYQLIYLPHYSPAFNLIQAFAKLKALLCKAEARSRESFVEAMGRATTQLTLRDAQGFFEHRGFRLVAQNCDNLYRVLLQSWFNSLTTDVQ